MCSVQTVGRISPTILKLKKSPTCLMSQGGLGINFFFFFFLYIVNGVLFASERVFMTILITTL